MVKIPTKRLFLRPNTQALVEGEGIKQVDYIDVSDISGPSESYGPNAAWGSERGSGGTVQKRVGTTEAYCATRAIDEKTVIVKEEDVDRTESLR